MVVTRSKCTCEECEHGSQLKQQLAVSRWKNVYYNGRVEQQEKLVNRLRKSLEARDLKIATLQHELDEKNELLQIVQKLKEEDAKQLAMKNSPYCDAKQIIKGCTKSWRPIDLKFYNHSEYNHIFIVAPDGGTTKIVDEGHVSLSKNVLEQCDKIGQIVFEVFCTVRDSSVAARSGTQLKKYLAPIVVPIIDPTPMVTVRKHRYGKGYDIVMDNKQLKLADIVIEKAKGSYTDYGNGFKGPFILAPKVTKISITPARSKNILLLKLKNEKIPHNNFSITTTMANEN